VRFRIQRSDGQWFSGLAFNSNDPVWVGGVTVTPGYTWEKTGMSGIEMTARTDLYKRVTGNRELGREVAAILAAHADSTLLCDDRKTMAWLLYYARPNSLKARYLNPMAPAIDDHYALSRDVSAAPDDDYLLISEHADEGGLRRRFREVVPLGRLSIPVHPDLSLDYRVWSVRGFLGYTR
jgi:hypothetical protein